MTTVLNIAQIDAITNSPGATLILDLLHEQLITKAEPIVEGFIKNEIAEGEDRSSVINNVTGDIFHYARKKLGFLVDILANVPGYKQKVRDFIAPIYDTYTSDLPAPKSTATVAAAENEAEVS